MSAGKLLEKGQRLPSMDVEPADGGAPVPLRRRSRLATVLVTMHPDCAQCTEYRAALDAQQSDIEDWDGRVVAASATDELKTAGIAVPAVLIADQWGELFVVGRAGDDHAFIQPGEVVSWLRYLAVQCPECQGEAL